MATVINGHELAATLLTQLPLGQPALQLKLVIILVGKDPASILYVKHKQEAAEKLHWKTELHHLPAQTRQETIINIIKSANQDRTVTGILVQLPLPKEFDQQLILNQIDPQKDVDSLTAFNLGRIVQGQNDLYPATVTAVLKIIDHYHLDLTGKTAVIVNSSVLIGRPLINLLLARGLTVICCQKETANLANFTKQADLLITAIGQPEIIKASMVKPKAIVLDIGISRLKSKQVVGDVAFKEVAATASLITPVPGGIGPLTVACLLTNLWLLYQQQFSSRK